MSITGHYQNGVIIPSGELSLPEGAEVEIVVGSTPAGGRMTDERYAKYLEAQAKIDALPDEESGDPFRGASHDEVLYGYHALYGNRR